ncbi:DUF2382 domain-containing protein [Georgenia sp. AZ-5]|uniref:DUF2382 domain-containing protein n=1 Tax=Georgenia sp. AZ-5 TaxID=3367526 RepID=UPI003754243B
MRLRPATVEGDTVRVPYDKDIVKGVPRVDDDGNLHPPRRSSSAAGTLTLCCREEVRLEREPITDANVGAAMDGPAISEEEHEVVLHQEVPVVSKEARPVEASGWTPRP